MISLRHFTIPAALAGVLALGACENMPQSFSHAGSPWTQPYSYDKAQKVQAGTTGGISAFNKQLVDEYFALSTKEAEIEYDWHDSDFFARKSIDAAGGGSVLPEDPHLWRVSPAEEKMLTNARGELMAALDAGGRTAKPVDAAVAQARYDCWVEEQEEGWQTLKIAQCRDEFYAALERLRAKAPMAAPKPQPAPPPSQYMVFFDWDSAAITDVADRVLRALASEWGDDPNALRLVGHADRSGPVGYNQRLSERRAASVREHLSRLGVGSGRMTTSGEGESAPLVPTPDGVREPQNRRVVISVQ